MRISIKLTEKENEYIANCPELDINCYGNNRKQAVRRIQQVIEFYVQSAKELGLDVEQFNEVAVDGESLQPFRQQTLQAMTESIN